MWVHSLGQEDPLEEDMAIYSSILAWGIPWTEEPGKLQSMGSQKLDTTEVSTWRPSWVLNILASVWFSLSLKPVSTFRI